MKSATITRCSSASGDCEPWRRSCLQSVVLLAAALRKRFNLELLLLDVERDRFAGWIDAVCVAVARIGTAYRFDAAVDPRFYSWLAARRIPQPRPTGEVKLTARQFCLALELLVRLF